MGVDLGVWRVVLPPCSHIIAGVPAGRVHAPLSPADPLSLQYVDLRTQYSELTTLTTQYIKFITETLRRLEEEEVGSGAGRHGRLCNQKERGSRGLRPHH